MFFKYRLLYVKIFFRHGEHWLELNALRSFRSLKPLTTVQKDSLAPLMVRNMSARRPGSRGRDISLDGRLLARGDKHTVAVWDIDKWKLIGMFNGHVSRVTCVSFSPNMMTLVSGSLDCTVRVWNLRTCTCTCILTDFFPIGDVTVKKC